MLGGGLVLGGGDVEVGGEVEVGGDVVAPAWTKMVTVVPGVTTLNGPGVVA